MTTDAAKIIRCPVCATGNRIPLERAMTEGKCGKCGSPLFKHEPIVLTAANFDAHAARSDIPLLVDFWATWCGPCRVMGPAFASAAQTLEPAMRLGKLDTEAEQTIAHRYSVQSIPTLILFFHGRELGRHSGAIPPATIISWARKTAGV
ncbi:thioredoxin TrxC [Novosphingobium aquimarinum]|jgi:thioredoxin 2|uniref:thioredoxin TrxC n=1 Tax=Novosphingobium aquimarinum TaxID=2682494 RepID=UPI0012EB5648|nr:thioredoxin TrxC [Novosphingobium aquimarinum]|tara:strand:- start:556 stop:1002 length:447 start_codon:yes stop_codon:yes gene_type:complete